MLTALPSLAAIVCMAVGCIVTGVAGPAMVLTHPLRKNSTSLAQLCFPVDSASAADPGGQRTARIIRFYWVGMGVLSAVAWTVVIAWDSIWPDTPLWAGLLVLFAIILFQTVSAQPALRCALNEPNPASTSFYSTLLFSLILQALVAFWAMYALLNSIVTLTTLDVATRGVAFAAIMIAATAFQIWVAWRVTQGWYPNILKHAVCLALFLLGFIGMIPPLGARLASFALLSTATDERPCTVLLFNSAVHDGVPESIVDTQHPSQSKELRVVFPSDNKLYVKESMASTTYLIDFKALIGTASCPNLGEQNGHQ
ncbi:hypothetical protein DWU98_04265 [Dyella monticola]|uniref:Uncharacterized protein n=2 Tax=Dyella monticola TaxID=1927958 RepID=A0A370X555_9GAMM|nr:hypothetical protein DWU98_04265 [Dyella monticola]